MTTTSQNQNQNQNAPAPSGDFSQAIEKLALKGDLNGLTNEQKVEYYRAVCHSLGLNPLTNPFQIIKLDGKEILYAKRDATDQLRRLYGVSVISQQVDPSFSDKGIYMVWVTVQDATGRQDTGTGAVDISNAKGGALANAAMKAETKAKRRATLSICGLGILDESEAETIPGAKENPVEAPAVNTPNAAAAPGKDTGSGDEAQRANETPQSDAPSGEGEADEESEMAYKWAFERFESCETVKEMRAIYAETMKTATDNGLTTAHKKDLERNLKELANQKNNG